MVYIFYKHWTKIISIQNVFKLQKSILDWFSQHFFQCRCCIFRSYLFRPVKGSAYTRVYAVPGNGRGIPPMIPKISHSRLVVALLALKVNWPLTVSLFLASQRSSSAASQFSIVTEMISPPVEPAMKKYLCLHILFRFQPPGVSLIWTSLVFWF